MTMSSYIGALDRGDVRPVTAVVVVVVEIPTSDEGPRISWTTAQCSEHDRTDFYGRGVMRNNSEYDPSFEFTATHFSGVSDEVFNCADQLGFSHTKNPFVE